MEENITKWLTPVCYLQPQVHKTKKHNFEVVYLFCSEKTNFWVAKRISNFNKYLIIKLPFCIMVKSPIKFVCFNIVFSWCVSCRDYRIIFKTLQLYLFCIFIAMFGLNTTFIINTCNCCRSV